MARSTNKSRASAAEGDAFSFPMLAATFGEKSRRGVYRDMDVALSMKKRGAASSKSSSVDSQEFDFAKCLGALDPACETPADQLFHKGHLLPLSSLKHEEEEDSSSDEDDGDRVVKADSFSFKGPVAAAALGSLSPDRFPSGSRSSSFSCYWDHSCVAPHHNAAAATAAGDSAAESRDSNGSSNDSCYEQHQQQEQQQQESSRSSSWKKNGFRWKVLLGGSSKRASFSTSSSSSSSSSFSRSHNKQQQQQENAATDRRNHSFTFGSSGLGADRRGRSSSKAGEVLQKYLKMLKPGNTNSSRSPSYSSSAASSHKSDGKVAPPPQLQFRQRSLQDWKAAMAYYDHHRQYNHLDDQQQLITCPSFLPMGSLRVSSFSSRRSSHHASAVTSSRSSPNHSGVLFARPTLVSACGGSDTELLQGAIAHCKQSASPASRPPPQQPPLESVPLLSISS